MIKKLFPKKSKKGITLVESVIAVVVLGIFVTGIISLLTTGGTKIIKITSEASAYAEATQKMDIVLSAISNGAAVTTDENTDVVTLDLVTLKNSLGFDSSINITAEISLYDPDGDPTVANVRGWYLTLTYDGVSTKGFASNSEGVFDS